MSRYAGKRVQNLRWRYGAASETPVMPQMKQAESIPDEEPMPAYQTPKKTSVIPPEPPAAPIAEPIKESVPVKQEPIKRSETGLHISPTEMRRAVILKEILDKPLALRRR